MSKTRLKKSLTLKLTTRDEAEERMRELALAANLRITLLADMDAQILAIKEQYEADLAAQDKAIQAAADDLEAWALANPDEFGKKKSIEMLSGILGFRTGTPKLSPLNKTWTWARITEAVCLMLPAFVRSKPEVDKEAILGQRDEEAIRAVLPLCGLRVVQDEGFFVEPKLTNPEVVS